MASGNKRYHIDHTFVSAPLMLGVINVYQICDLACSYDYAVGDHRQICHEISYVVAGEGVFERNGRAYRLKKGDLFLVRSGDMHNVISSAKYPLRYLCLGFTFNRGYNDFGIYEEIAAFFEQFDHPVAQDRYGIYEVFSAAVREISAPGALSEELFAAMVRQLVIHTYRCYRGAEPGKEVQVLSGGRVNPLIYEMTRYIDEHLSSMEGLGQMGKTLGYSYGYLSRLFSGTMGITLREYYNRRRFERATQLLQEPHTLAAVAEMLGFADAPTFCKAFKRYCKISPGEYRRQQKTAVS